MIIGYTVVDDQSPIALSGKVQTLLREGTIFRVSGGLMNKDRFFQTMVKENKSEFVGGILVSTVEQRKMA